MRLQSLTICLICLCITGYADDGAMSGVGGTVSLLSEHQSVRMVREKVDAKISWETATVRCEFVFKNEGKATTVKMGFPEDAGGDALPLAKSHFGSFRSWVDGKPAKTTFVLTNKGYAPEGPGYVGWHVKEVHFAAGQTRKVVEEYTSGLGGDISGSASFAYILKTGSSWKGKIGEAVITIDASEVSPYYKVKPEPSGFGGGGGRLVWKFSNFEPTKDIGVELVPRLEVCVDGQMVTLWDPKSYVKDGVVMVSTAYLKSMEGFETIWDSKNRTCVLMVIKPSRNFLEKTPLHQLKMTVGSRKAVLDGSKEVRLPRAPYLMRYDGLIIPIVAVVKEMGGKVSVDKKAGIIVLSLLGSG